MVERFMKQSNILWCVLAGYFVTACAEPKSVEQKIEDSQAKVYNLTPDERNMAKTNAKAYFEQPRIEASGKTGTMTECKPSDSNTNGLVSCFGMVPKPDKINSDGTVVPQGYVEEKRYCGYRPEKIGCQRSEDG